MRYALVSMGAILRDYIDPEYASDKHKRLVDIADSLYNMNIPVSEWGDNPEYNYKKLYADMGEDFWRLVLQDMHAIDSQLVSDRHVSELSADYADMLKEER